MNRTEAINQIIKANDEIESILNKSNLGETYMVLPSIESIRQKMSEIEIYSPTGRCNGSGSDRYKSVTKLSKLERIAVRVGCTVYVDSNTDYMGIKYKTVEYNSGYYNHRQGDKNIVPSEMITL